ncbi:hypothetical protein MHO82_12865 [Vibrio sp. Of7-15]|uniref:hypothetical protein n=1 Tax=Vibrio sp. Of7-15 TaxID=2724879 RepID=UPI001EF23D18|nr:hypothetical protein [Vibrio sp. Of7-15]MCG7497755.1 hypothetical protein [Vibrio sp. Of7-15]
MDPSWINALVGVASFLTLLSSILIGYLFRLSKELSDHKLHVARYMATKNELKDLTVRVERQMESGFDRLSELLKKEK